MDWKKLIYPLLFLLILLDLGHTFWIYMDFPTDGDMSKIILPTDDYKHVLEDPLGLAVLTNDSVYAAPNRYFAHLSMSTYFHNAPLLFQKIVSPIQSIYVSMAFAKTVVHLSILLLLAFLIAGKRTLWHRDVLVVMAILFPLFQSSGYGAYMGIIDASSTYMFFYSAGMILCLLFLSSWFYKYYHDTKVPWSIMRILCLISLGFVLALHGSLNAPVIMIFGLLLIIHHLVDKIRPNYREWMILAVTAVFCLYSLYIGRNNIEGLSNVVSIAERYSRLPQGLFEQLTTKLGFPILIVMTIVNFVLLKKHQIQHKKLLQFAKWAGLFTIIYLLLLPLGGYREYRPLIIRRDTFLPIILLLMTLYGLSSLKLLKELKNKKFYVLGLVLFSLIFINADLKKKQNADCEKTNLEAIVNSHERVVKLPENCRTLSWEVISNPDYSKANIELLKLWNIVDEDKSYYFRND